MAARGPVPKRSDQRRRTNSPGAEKVTAQPKVGGVYKVPLARGEWHDLAKEFWQALRKSDQTALYQPSDWQHAYTWTAILSQQLESGRPSAMMLAAWDSAMARLLVTEGDRRRARIELEKPGGKREDAEHKAGVASMQAFRAKLTGGS